MYTYSKCNNFFNFNSLQLDTWRYRAKNYIMYVPDGAESQVPGPKPELQYHNTRLKKQPFDYAKNKEAINALARNQVSFVMTFIFYETIVVGT